MEKDNVMTFVDLNNLKEYELARGVRIAGKTSAVLLALFFSRGKALHYLE